MYFAGNLQDDSFVKVSDENEGEKVSNGTIIFAGISLANMYANVTGFAFLCGMSSAVETVASQQNGAKRYKVSYCKVFLHKCQYFCTVDCLGCWNYSASLHFCAGSSYSAYSIGLDFCERNISSI